MNDSDKKYWKEDYDLIEVYSLKEIPEEFHLRDTQQFGIPTEIVIMDTKAVEPIQARYWRIDRWLVDGEIVNYGFLQKLPDFKGYGKYAQLYVVELWGDEGDDGHINQILQGYGLTTEIKKVIKHFRWEK